jgi:hypothetical protein
VFQNCKWLIQWKLYLDIRLRSKEIERIAMRIQTALRAIILTIIGAAVMAGANADSLVLASVGTAANPNQTNSRGPTVPVIKNREWVEALAGSSWVSIAPTGNAANSNTARDPIADVVSFFDIFDINEVATGGTLNVMTDDSVTVILNGGVIYAAGLENGKAGAKCSGGESMCSTAVTVHLPADLLYLGANTLEFRVTRGKKGTLGLDYTGRVNFTKPTYPMNGGSFAPGGLSSTSIPPSTGGGSGGGGGGSPVSPVNPTQPTGSGTLPVSVVPEPPALALFSLGILALAILERWRSRRNRRLKSR